MHPLFTLFFAICSEIVATTALKYSVGFSKVTPTLLALCGYGIAFYLLALTLKNMNLGTAYAIWSGLGTAGTVVIGSVLWQEQLTFTRLLGIALIIIGVLVLNMFGEGATI